jgi:uncharacterized protein (TIGR03437 family)
MKTKITLLVLFLGACAWQSSAQPAFDSSGDGQLSGAYYMRQVFYFVTDDSGDLGGAINIQGTITFDGNGNYTFSGSLLDSSTQSITPVTATSSGTYVISASGEGYISGIVGSIDSNITPGDVIIGLVSHGVFIGSSTENSNSYNDMFIAAPVGSTTATNATLSGSYAVAYFNPLFGTAGAAGGGGDALLTMSADGQGNIGSVNVTGYEGTSTTAGTETLSGVTYSFSNGAAQINFGGTAGSGLIAGTELLYITPDGNFVFGGSYNGFDMFAGVRAATSNPSNYDGLYYQAGLDLDNSTLSSGYSLLDSYYGSLQAFSQNIIGHQRVNSLLIYDGSSDFTYYDSYTLNGDGTSDDETFDQEYVSSTDGTIRIGYGIGPYLSLNVAFQAPPLSGSGVYLSPVGVENAASSAPFTAFLSPGEFITLYGSGLAPTTNSASVPFPDKLNGVQVFINQVAAPIYFVSPNQINVIVPYITTPESVAQIQVINNNANSNVVTLFTGLTSAGVFTNNPVGGIGVAASERPDGSVISESNPAQIGETEAMYLAGFGAVSNQPADGAPAPSNPLSYTSATPSVYLTDSAGNFGQPTVTFSGLAPGFAGLYQTNFTIPTGLVSGEGYLEIQGPDSDSFEATLWLTTTTSAARPKSGTHRRLLHRHRAPQARPSAPSLQLSLQNRH